MPTSCLTPSTFALAHRTGTSPLLAPPRPPAFALPHRTGTSPLLAPSRPTAFAARARDLRLASGPFGTPPPIVHGDLFDGPVAAEVRPANPRPERAMLRGRTPIAAILAPPLRADGASASRAGAFRAAIEEMTGSSPASIHAALDHLGDAAPRRAGLAEPAAVVARASAAIVDLDHDVQLRLLERLAPALRRDVVARLPTATRKHLTAHHPHPRSNSNRPFEFDWTSWAHPGGGYCPVTAWGLSILSSETYEPFAAAASKGPFADLARAGFSLHLIGDERTAARRGQPRIATPFAVAARDDVAIVAIRGSQSDKSWDNDKNLRLTPGHGGSVHTGFAKTADEVWAELGPVLEAARGELPRDQELRVYLTGHSLGGITAVLLADRIADEPGMSVESVYGFGMPRGVDRSAARHLEEKLRGRIWRIENHGDPVVNLPPSFMGGDKYSHVGTAIYCAPQGYVARDLPEKEVRRASRVIDEVASGWDAHHAGNYVRKLFLGKSD